MENKEDIKRALANLGWKARTDPERPEVIGSYGKYHLIVSFEGTTPTSVIISYVSRGGGLLSRKWPGLERLPTPQKVVQALSRDS